MRRVICIAEHDHFADYAEPANVVPVLPQEKTKGSTYDKFTRLGLWILGVCTIVAVVFVYCTWNL